MSLLASTAFGVVVSGKARWVRWFVWISLSAFVLLLSSAGFNAQATPSFLAQVVTETHQGGVADAAADRARRIVVTTGRDGTARVWSLPDLSLLRVLRAPLGSYLAVPIAVSPDGNVAAAASGNHVLLFDVGTGEIVKQIPVRSTNYLENHAKDSVINALAISPDGQEIAIGRGLKDDGCWLYLQVVSRNWEDWIHIRRLYLPARYMLQISGRLQLLIKPTRSSSPSSLWLSLSRGTFLPHAFTAFLSQKRSETRPGAQSEAHALDRIIPRENKKRTCA